MYTHPSSGSLWRFTRLMGRTVAALAAGAVFAALAWESASDPEQAREAHSTDHKLTTPEQPASPASRVLAQTPAARSVTDSPWALARRSSKEEPWLPTAAPTDGSEQANFKPATQTFTGDEAQTAATALPHSRAPP